MPRRSRGRFFAVGLLPVLVGAVALAAASLFVEHRHDDRILPAAKVPLRHTAIVFGAGLAKGTVPSPILAERLDTALALWRAGKVQSVLLSGDSTDPYHEETRAMRRYLEEAGVPKTVLVDDFAGVSTYDTCVRARELFGVSQAVLVTQAFHLPRALYLANALGIDAVGVAADEGRSSGGAYALRESLSRAMAVAQALFRPRPAFPRKHPE